MEFLDTNVLVYAVSRQAADQAKATVARDLLRRGPGEFAISLQVLQEFCGQWRAFTVLEPTLLLFEAALDLCARHPISYYDAAILAAAKQLGRNKVHSEDLNDGQDYDGVRVDNPFRGIASTPQP